VSTRSFERIAAPHPTQAAVFTFREIKLPSKNLLLVRLVSSQLPGFFLKNFVKMGEGIVPWVAPEQGASLHWCKDARYSGLSVVTNKLTQTTISFGTQRHVNKACDIYLLMSEV
jgi:hypothetical protein